MRGMRRTWRVPMFCVLLNVGASAVATAQARAVAMDPATRAQIEDLLAKREANGAKIKTLRMSGTFRMSVEERSPPNKPSPRVLREQYTFEYFQSGPKQRFDKHYQIAVGPGYQPRPEQGQTFHLVYDPPRQLTHQAGRADGGNIGHYDPLNYHWMLGISWLDACSRPRDIPTEMHRIRRALVLPDRPGQRWTFKVAEDRTSGKALQMVEMRTSTPDEGMGEWR